MESHILSLSMNWHKLIMLMLAYCCGWTCYPSALSSRLISDLSTYKPIRGHIGKVPIPSGFL